jgi:hypothetical protein
VVNVLSERGAGGLCRSVPCGVSVSLGGWWLVKRTVRCGVSVSLGGWWRGWWLVKKECAAWRVSVSEWLVACEKGLCVVACQCLWVAGGVACKERVCCVACQCL